MRGSTSEVVHGIRCPRDWGALKHLRISEKHLGDRSEGIGGGGVRGKGEGGIDIFRGLLVWEGGEEGGGRWGFG